MAATLNGETELATRTAVADIQTDTTAIKAVTDLLPNDGALTDIGTDTARLTAVRAAILTDWIDGGRLDLILDAVLAAVAVIDGYHDVPSPDSVANAQMRDVLGIKTDTHDGNSAYALLHKLDEHIHTVQLVYPTLADGVALATEAGDWALGTITEIVPANAITSDFDIHEIVVEAANTADKTYELHLFSGAGDTLIGKVRFAAGAVRGGVPNVNEQMPIIAANSRIRGRLAIQDGGSKTATISVRYHTY